MKYTVKKANHETHFDGEIMRSDVVVKSGEEAVHISTASKQNDKDRLELYMSRSELQGILQKHFPQIWERSQKWTDLKAKLEALHYDQNGNDKDEEGQLQAITEAATLFFGVLE